MSEQHFIIQKYKPKFMPSLNLRKPRFNHTSIYSLMMERGYKFVFEWNIEGEKIKNYTKYVEEYLQARYKEGDTETNDSYLYIWHVHYPRQLLDYKTIAIYKKKMR